MKWNTAKMDKQQSIIWKKPRNMQKHTSWFKKYRKGIPILLTQLCTSTELKTVSWLKPTPLQTSKDIFLS